MGEGPPSFGVHSALVVLTSEALPKGTLPLYALSLPLPLTFPCHLPTLLHFFVAELTVPCSLPHTAPAAPSQALTARASSLASTRRFYGRCRGAKTSLWWRVCSWLWPSWPCCWYGPEWGEEAESMKSGDQSWEKGVQSRYMAGGLGRWRPGGVSVESKTMAESWGGLAEACALAPKLEGNQAWSGVELETGSKRFGWERNTGPRVRRCGSNPGAVLEAELRRCGHG